MASNASGVVWIAVLLVMMSGCAQPPGVPEPSDRTGLFAREASLPQPEPIQFVVQDSFGSVFPIAGHRWAAENVTGPGLLLLHGGSGVKENYWGRLTVPGYSAGAEFAVNRTVYAIDRPAYGASGGSEEASNVRYEADILDQVAGQIRAGTYVVDDGEPTSHEMVTALGVSMGAFFAGVVQGLHGSFDAIVPLAWAPNSVSQELAAAVRCQELGGEDCWPEDHADDFVLSRVNETVVIDVVAGYESAPAQLSTDFFAWHNGPQGTLVPDANMANDSPNLYAETVASVDVPVLTMVGEHDWYIDSARAERHGRESYEASSDATSEIIPAIGHMVLHHENRFQVRERIDSWLVERNL